MPVNEGMVPEYPQGSSVPKLDAEIELFVQHIDALQSSLPGVKIVITTAEQEAYERFKRYADKYGEIAEQTDNSTKFAFRQPYNARAARLSKAIKEVKAANEIIPRVFVLALVSQFDAFLGRLLRVLFLLRPELIANSERSLTLSQLLELGTIESATEYLLEKEIEGVLRKSHVEQFSWMESKFGIKLHEGLSSWPVFVELTERRNLFAHSNGVISDQYLAVCNAHNVQLPSDCSRGTVLDVKADYFMQAYCCVYEIGVKLAQVLWRKLKPEQMGDADDSLISVTYDLIVSSKYDLACNLLDFACETLKKHGSEQARLIMIINRAQAYKWAGNAELCKKTLSDEDWSACSPQFHLAVAVLEDEFDKATDIMRTIGAKGTMQEIYYQDWPIFRKFRLSSQFAQAYLEVFGQPFVHVEKLLITDERERQREMLTKLKSMLEENDHSESKESATDRKLTEQ